MGRFTVTGQECRQEPGSVLIESVIADVNAAGITVVSIDMPSGLSADAVEPIGASIEADTTVALGAPKLPLVLPPGETHAGDIVIADIGIPSEVLEAVEGPRVHLLTRAVPVRGLTPGVPRLERALLEGESRSLI